MPDIKKVRPEDLNPGDTISMEDLVSESEYSDEDFDELTKLYDSTISNLKEGEIVKGRIVSIGDKEVRVDIGFKSEGALSLLEFGEKEEIKIGNMVEVFLESVENKDGHLILSKKRADFYRIWQKVVHAFEHDEVITGKISRRIKGGMVVDLMGIDAFLPGSQIDVRPIRDFDALVGQDMDFKVVKINQPTENVVVSHKVLIEKDIESQRSEILSNLEPGQVLEGTVKNITDFGVFIDLGGVDGLLHITDLSWGRVNHPSEVVSLDQTLNVVILEFDEEKRRISLGLKQLQPHPWENIEERFPIGAEVSGKIVSIADYGAFVEIEKGIEGLIHISEMSWTQHIKHPSEKVQMGQQVSCVILSIDKETKKISLGMKQLEEDPWEKLLEKYPIDSTTEGIIRNITNFGVFVELEPGVDGLIHISDLSWTKKLRHPGEMVKKGDNVKVQVIGVDSENRRISLGVKQLEVNPYEAFQNTYPVGSFVTAKIEKVTEKGLLVSLPFDLEGMIPGTQLMEKSKDLSKNYKVEQELKVAVIEFNIEDRKVILSETEGARIEDEETVKSYSKSSSKSSKNETAMAAAMAEAGISNQQQPAVTDSDVEAELAREESLKQAKATAKKAKSKPEPNDSDEQAEESVTEEVSVQDSAKQTTSKAKSKESTDEKS